MRVLSSEERALFTRYLQGALSEEEAQALEARLVDDDALAQAFERFARVDGAAVESFDAKMPRNFTRGVEQRINKRSGGRFFVEDIVSSRFIPWFIAGSIVALGLFVFLGRDSLHLASDEAPEATAGDMGAAATDDNVSTAGGGSGTDAAPATTRPVQRLNRPRPTVAPMTHVASVPIVRTALAKDALLQALHERFGEPRVTEAEGYFVVRVRAAELGEALLRMNDVTTELTEQSMEITQDEIDHPVIQVWWR